MSRTEKRKIDIFDCNHHSSYFVPLNTGYIFPVIMDATKKFLRLAGSGLKDCVFGTFKLYRLDRDLENEKRESARASSSEPMSTLARRRAEKMKQPSGMIWSIPMSFISTYLSMIRY